MYSKERKFVPRFRRKNAHLIDADDEEAQAAIEKDLQSDFTWKSDLNENTKEQFDNFNQNQDYHQQILSTNDQNDQNISYDLQNSTEQLWKIHHEDENLLEWKNQHSYDDQQKQIIFSIDEIQHEQQWSLNDIHSIELNHHDSNDQIHQQQFDTNSINNHQQLFIQGDSFQDQMKFAIESTNDQSKIFLTDGEDLEKMSIDSKTIPSKDFQISLPEKEMIIRWLEGISQYELSIPVEQISRQYSPINEKDIQIDCFNLRSFKWSIDLLKENLIRSYFISLPNYFPNLQYSIEEDFHLNLSINEQTNDEYSISIETNFNQNLSISTNDIRDQILSIIDLIQLKNNFENDEQIKIIQWSLDELKTIILNLSPNEIIECFYSPIDQKQISFENIFIQSDEGNARAFRRYRCKHFSIKTNEDYQLDSTIHSYLYFKGNEPFAIGEQTINNDIQLTIKDENIFVKGDEQIQCYDIQVNDSIPIILGPCLYRSNYERELPKTSINSHREIGYISFDASLNDPIYYLNKSYKRFVHLPKNLNQCSFHVYEGYQQFIENIRLNPMNYVRSFDSTDLRHLLYWYSEKQYLFSSTDSTLLKPPRFICRRTVLRTIFANLYSDGDPWKLLVIRVKGQFYLALANKASKKPDEMTEDEYSGYHFEQLLTSNQPNTTRMKDQIPLENPQHQFHTVRYWNFGKYNILYSNEIDGEILQDQLDKIRTNDLTLKVEQTNDKSEEEINKTVEDSSENKIDSTNEEQSKEKKRTNDYQLKSGYVEMKCTNRKIFYRDEHKLHTLHWWAQMWLANINTLIVGCKTSNDGLIDQLELFSIEQIVYKFFSSFNLYLKYCFSYLYSFLELIEKTVVIDDPTTIHQFSYIPQPLEIDPITGKAVQVDLPKYVPFRYTLIKRSEQRHHNFISQDYLDFIQRTTISNQTNKTVEDEMKKRFSHRGRSSSSLKQIKTKKKS